MIKISTIALLFVLAFAVNAQNNAELIQEFRASQMPTHDQSKLGVDDNSIDVLFKLNDIDNITTVDIIVKNVTDKSIVSTKTLTISKENELNYFSYKNRKRLVKRGFVAFPEYIGKLSLSDISIEATVTTKNKQASKFEAEILD